MAVLLILNLSSYWLYRKSSGHAGLLLGWLLFTLFISYAWVERTQALTWWQLVGHSLRGGLWLPFSGLLSFSFWRYSWRPPQTLFDQVINHRWQILPVLLVLYLVASGFCARPHFVWRLKLVFGWCGALLLLAGGLLLLQWGCDHLAGINARFSARLFWLLWLNGKYVLWLGLLLRLRNQPVVIDYRWAGGSLLVLLALGWSFSGQFFAKTAMTPQIVAHRGVNGNTGVPNTLQALHQTVPARPAMVEIDLRLTGDQKFVVSHDATTGQLAATEQTVATTTLAQLQRLPLTKNGQTAHYASFTAYLKAAQQAHQPLLVELKAKQDWPAVTTQFVQQYRGKLLPTTQFHCTSLAAVKLLRQHGLTPVGYILPFTVVGLPANQADFYSTDWRTLNPLIVAQARRQGKPLYVWTVEHNWALQAVRHLNAAKVITDHTSQVRRELQAKPQYLGNLLLLLLNF
ncbi:glycerophosphodiester phosphodiesterase family protein [Loigolactobacillus binensis]|uniref:Glycerophosphodiester phosphodiesterase family protein n=1 Tax=Loigolactobacillus binensis TaxID=2559922 RepID=A0ABW3EC77_9LACO|nr:glycerophosphodiester phosphodiesterase family protein [Loigolactobacillus binensis]